MKKKKIRYFILGIITLIFCYISFWLLDVYPADDIALEVLNSENVSVIEEDVIAIYPKETSNIGLIFYPGAKAEHLAYLPILEKTSDEAEINCFLVKMPLTYAFLNEDAAQSVIDANEDITSWYIMGHSLGSSMAGSFAGKNQDLFKGVIYLGGYIYGDFPAEKSLTIYGSLETRVKSIIDYTENVVEIEGANHAQFGNYGEQDGDAKALISREQQQEITVMAIKEFINN